MPYDPLVVQPMREELTSIGVKELRTVDEVDEAMKQQGTSLVVVNSVCGCAAGGARPGIALALQHEVLPDNVFTVFAGQDVEATQRMRDYFTDQVPSSPSIALFQDGQLVAFMHRHHIEGSMPEQIAQALTGAFDKICSPQAS